MAANVAVKAAGHRPRSREERKVILAFSLGTIFEWYDFYLYGTLAVIIGRQFFSAFDPSTQAIFALPAFAAGFLCGRSGRSCSAGSATWWGASTRFWSPS